METSVEHTDSQKSQNNGPRVYFNRDVHVKRIGSRPNEHLNHPTHQIHANHLQSPQLRRELPTDLTEEGILKEAALVLSQAERVKCTAEGGSDIVGGRVNVKSRGRIERKNDDSCQFHSLPTRKKTTKPVSRSDASAKKSKRPSIFNIFTKKGDQSADQTDSKENQRKKIPRSKSDVGEFKEAISKAIRKRNNSENEDVVISKKKPLSPIIENPPRETYFSDPIKPARTNRNGSTVNLPSGNIVYTSQEDLDLVPSKPIADSIKDSISSIVNHSKSPELK